jgi:hypothetical protein
VLLLACTRRTAASVACSSTLSAVAATLSTITTTTITTTAPAQVPQLAAAAQVLLPYSDEEVANREIRVWHFVVEKGY